MSKEIHTDADWQTEKERLNGEIRKLEAALIEAKEVTRVKLTEEIADEFTVKLREAKRDRTRIEDEFEEASAQWRGERRRLNSEIDDLEQSVQEFRSAARRAKSSDGSGSQELRDESESATRLKRQAEDELAHAKQQWATKREELEERIRNLETQVVEALERSANPSRSADALQTRLDGEMDARIERIQSEAAREKTETEKEWQAERGRLHLQISRLEKTAGTTSSSPGADPKAVEDLERKRQELASRLEAAETAQGELERRLVTERSGWKAERESLEASISKLETSLSAGASKVDPSELDALREELEARIRTAGQALADVEERSRAASAEWETEKQDLDKTLLDLKERLGESSSTWAGERDGLTAKLEEAETARSEFERRLVTERGEWETERDSLTEKISGLETSVAEGSSRVEASALNALREELEARIRTATQAQADVEQRFEAASAEWKTEKQELDKTALELNASLAENASRIDQAELDAMKDELLSKLTESEEKRTLLEGEQKAAADQWEDERSRLKQQMEELEKNAEAAGNATETELREKLSLEYEWKIQELTFQKDQLEQKSSATGGVPSGAEGDTDISEEIAGIDVQLAELISFIDDPKSALPAVIRKNVERAELEAYRRGLSFSLDRVKKDEAK